MADFAYAIYTELCTYLLDDMGVCLWVLSPEEATADAGLCVGAHFVACSDSRVPGGLIGELVVGACALFVCVSPETGRPSLLRTTPITRIQQRSTKEEPAPAHAKPERPSLPRPTRTLEDDTATVVLYAAGPPRATGLRLSTLPPPPSAASEQETPMTAGHPRLLVFALDCLSPTLLFDRYLHRLPTFARLVREGTWGPLRSVDPPITVPAWACMMTGCLPSRLGIYGFRHRRLGTYDSHYLADGSHVDRPRVWDVLSSAGFQVGVMGIPQTFPPESGPGIPGRGQAPA